jgi:hypothetical protein
MLEGMQEERNTSTLSVAMQISTTTMESNMEVTQKIKNRTTT